MTQATKNLLEQVLSLPPEELIVFAENFHENYHGSIDPEIETAWMTEVESRIDAHESGVTKSVPVEDVLRRLDS